MHFDVGGAGPEECDKGFGHGLVWFLHGWDLLGGLEVLYEDVLWWDFLREVSDWWQGRKFEVRGGWCVGGGEECRNKRGPHAKDSRV